MKELIFLSFLWAIYFFGWEEKIWICNLNHFVEFIFEPFLRE
jgi:hypothetical protein